MKSLFSRMWREDEGVLTFEWILLITVLTIGVVGGLSTVRDAVITELGDVAQAVVSLDQGYYILPPWEVVVADCANDGAEGSRYIDASSFGEGRGGVTSQTNAACMPPEAVLPTPLPDGF